MLLASTRFVIDTYSNHRWGDGLLDRPAAGAGRSRFSALRPYAPGRHGSSLMMGFAWDTGGRCVPFIGMLADRIGIDAALSLMAFTPLAKALLALPLPRSDAPAVVAHVGPNRTD